ncbi:uncharacterized protein TM35_000084610 [Trypanosoma theileri]|uniref:Checkpoint protein n=1 Tax=Trypanosoma theileri TaxID=67003 RepID=A0A1X0P1S9_9TRYP|nr:uncharacterized protein TM35_000084610 [Trypanosoma theileri]ORC90663.1 hypothetical protein TM35_000084610 [Trypanosoma theileri]
MNEHSVASFTLPSVKILSSCLRYLSFKDNGIKFVLSTRKGSSELRLTRSDVPECSYSEVIIELPENEMMINKIATDDSKCEKSISWIIDCSLFLRVLRLFENYEYVTLHLGCDLTNVYLHSVECERWARVAVLHDLGPLLNVDNEVTVLHRICSLQDFFHIVRYIATTNEATCTVLLRFDNLQSVMELKTTSATASLVVDGQSLQDRIEGRVATMELVAFADLAMRVRQNASLHIGIGMNDLTFFRLDWKTITMRQSTASLYFCSE